MIITEIQITPVKPQGGLVAFASFVFENALYCGSIGVFTRPDGGYRLVYPTKNVRDHRLDIYHPISGKAGNFIEKEVIAKYEEVMKHDWNRHHNPNSTV